MLLVIYFKHTTGFRYPIVNESTARRFSLFSLLYTVIHEDTVVCDWDRKFWTQLKRSWTHVNKGINIGFEELIMRISRWRISELLCIDEESWSEDEQDPVVLDQTWRGDPDSEADSVDSDHEDPLKWEALLFTMHQECIWVHLQAVLIHIQANAQFVSCV